MSGWVLPLGDLAVVFNWWCRRRLSVHPVRFWFPCVCQQWNQQQQQSSFLSHCAGENLAVAAAVVMRSRKITHLNVYDIISISSKLTCYRDWKKIYSTNRMNVRILVEEDLERKRLQKKNVEETLLYILFALNHIALQFNAEQLLVLFGVYWNVSWSQYVIGGTYYIIISRTSTQCDPLQTYKPTCTKWHWMLHPHLVTIEIKFKNNIRCYVNDSILYFWKTISRSWQQQCQKDA